MLCTSFANRVPPKEIQGHLGHSSITVPMDRYGHLFPENLDRLAEVWSRPTAGPRRSGDGRGGQEAEGGTGADAKPAPDQVKESKGPVAQSVRAVDS